MQSSLSYDFHQLGSQLKQATQGLQALELYKSELESELRRKTEICQRLVENDSSFEEENDMEEEEGDEILLSEEESQAYNLEQQGDYEGALSIYVKIQTPTGLFSFVCLCVRHFFDRLESDEVLCNKVLDAFETLEKQYPELSRECDTERAAFLGQIVEDLNGAMDAYQRSFTNNSNDPSLLYNYANFISFSLETDAELNLLSEDLYRRALDIDPEMVGALNNLSAMLIENSRSLSSMQDRERLEEAKTFLFRAQQLQPGLPAYNIACVDAMLDDYESCRRNLILALETLNLSKADLTSDVDLAKVRNMDWFVNLLMQR